MIYKNITDQPTRDELARTLRRWRCENRKYASIADTNPVTEIVDLATAWNYRGRIFGLRRALDIIDRGG